jgi:hypothetical protein
MGQVSDQEAANTYAKGDTLAVSFWTLVLGTTGAK